MVKSRIHPSNTPTNSNRMPCAGQLADLAALLGLMQSAQDQDGARHGVVLHPPMQKTNAGPLKSAPEGGALGGVPLQQKGLGPTTMAFHQILNAPDVQRLVRSFYLARSVSLRALGVSTQ